MKISPKVTDAQLKEALSLFRDSVHEFQPSGVAHRVISPLNWQLAFAVVALLALLITGIPVYYQRQASLASAAAEISKQDDALLRGVESDLSVSVPQPMQPLELLMASDTVTDSERAK